MEYYFYPISLIVFLFYLKDILTHCSTNSISYQINTCNMTNHLS